MEDKLSPVEIADKIIELSDTHIVGIKNVTFNEWFFQGHFPGNPVMPGVLQIEALAQCGGILAINLSGEGQYDTYFLKIDNCKFKQMVRPGDTLILKMELSAPIRRGICEMRGTAYVGNKVCAEGDLVAQIRGELTKELEFSGPLRGVIVCKYTVPEISSAMSRKTGWRVTRVALRPRNPALGSAGRARTRWPTPR